MIMRRASGDYVEIEVSELREESAALRRLEFAAGATVVLLDAAGEAFSTAQFAQWLGAQRDRGIREVSFCAAERRDFLTALRAAATSSFRFRR